MPPGKARERTLLERRTADILAVRIGLFLPASISARNVFSSITVIKKFRLFGDHDPNIVTVSADQKLDHVGNASVFALGRDTNSLLEGRVNS